MLIFYLSWWKRLVQFLIDARNQIFLHLLVSITAVPGIKIQSPKYSYITLSPFTVDFHRIAVPSHTPCEAVSLQSAMGNAWSGQWSLLLKKKTYWQLHWELSGLGGDKWIRSPWIFSSLQGSYLILEKCELSFLGRTAPVPTAPEPETKWSIFWFSDKMSIPSPGPLKDSEDDEAGCSHRAWV